MPECADLYEQACDRVSALGGTAGHVDFAPFVEAGKMLFSGPWIAERVSAIRGLIDIEQASLLDVTRNVLSPPDNSRRRTLSRPSTGC